MFQIKKPVQDSVAATYCTPKREGAPHTMWQKSKCWLFVKEIRLKITTYVGVCRASRSMRSATSRPSDRITRNDELTHTPVYARMLFCWRIRNAYVKSLCCILGQIIHCVYVRQARVWWTMEDGSREMSRVPFNFTESRKLKWFLCVCFSIFQSSQRIC